MNSTKNTLPLPRYAFWDVQRDSLDPAKDKQFIISRMFERGNFDDVLSLVAYYGVNEAANALKSNKHLNRQGVFLAHSLLGLPLQDFKAYGTFKHH